MTLDTRDIKKIRSAVDDTLEKKEPRFVTYAALMVIGTPAILTIVGMVLLFHQNAKADVRSEVAKTAELQSQVYCSKIEGIERLLREKFDDIEKRLLAIENLHPRNNGDKR